MKKRMSLKYIAEDEEEKLAAAEASDGFKLPQIIKRLPPGGEQEAQRHVIFSPGETTVELLSPNKQDRMKIKNCRARVASDPARFIEL